jgi:hypothetical protein
MSNIAASFVVPQFATGPFDWANHTLSAMRSSALHLLQQPLSAVSDFLQHSEDRSSMGCVHPGRARQPVIDDDGFVVTDWKASGASTTSPLPHVDSAHIITRNPAGVPYSQQRRDGAHILDSWTANRSQQAATTAPEEDIPLQLEPTPLYPGT